MLLAAGTLLGLVMAGTALAGRRYIDSSRIAATLRACKVTAEDCTVPDVVLIHDRPVRFTVDGKHLYVKPFFVEQFDAFLIEFVVFLQRMKLVTDTATTDFQTILAGVERNGDTDTAAARFIALMGKAPARRAAVDLLARTVLRDRTCNPGRLRRRHLLRHLTLVDILQMIVVLYKYNVGEGVKKKLSSLLDQILQGFGGTGATLSSEKPASVPTNGDGRLYPDSPFAPPELRKSPPPGSENTNPQGTAPPEPAYAERSL
jgi:hypothetical protein